MRPLRRTTVGLALIVAAATGLSAQSERPNILLIMADDLGYETIGANGGTSYATPNLDRLAASGIRFTQAYAQPLCTPTRLQLMTGQYNFRNWKAFGVMDPGETTFAHILADAGYRTAIAGKWQLYSYNPPEFWPEWRGKGMRPEQSGFQEYALWHAEHTEDKGSRYADSTILQNGRYRTDTKGKYGPDLYAEFLMDFFKRNRNQPFFAYYPMALTHNPFNPTPHSDVWATGDRLQSDNRFFKDMVEYMDVIIGRLVARLDELGLRERTLILFYSDNGTLAGIQSRMGDRVIEGGKGKTTDNGIHVPLIANWQGTTPEGRVLDDLIDSTDFLPTIAEMAGARIPAGMPIDGRSFLPQLYGRKGDPRDWVFFHHDPTPGWEKHHRTLERFARDRRFKLYQDGRFYDCVADPGEQRTIPYQGMQGEAAAAHKMLRGVLDRLK
jgi:arylsulfatase A-like enzyme